MAIGFSTGISGVNKPTIGSDFSKIKGAEKTQLNNFPVSVKQSITKQITPPPNTEIGELKPVGGQSNVMKKFVLDLTEDLENGGDGKKVIESYVPTGIDVGKIISASSDAANGSGYKELIKHEGYNMIPKEVMFHIYNINTPEQELTDDDLKNIELGEQSTTKNIGEGAVSFAGGLPKVLAESGILDKPADWLVENLVNPLRIKSGKKALDVNSPEYIKFSQDASGSHVGGDPESKAAARTETILDMAGLGGGIVTAVKGGIKYGAKKTLKKALSESIETGGKKVIKEKSLDSTGKSVLNIIRESDTLKNKAAALGRGGLDKSEVGKRWKNSKNIVKPSQKSIDSAATISTEIKKPAKFIGELYTQVDNKIGEIAERLSPELKKITIPSAITKTTKNKGVWSDLTQSYVGKTTKRIVTKLDSIKSNAKSTADMSIKEWDLAPAWKNKFKKSVTQFTKTKNLDEVWNIAKDLDKQIPDRVKRGVNLNGKEQDIYNAWRGVRGTYNTYMDDVSNSIKDVKVKSEFKKMSNLFFAKGQMEKNVGQFTKPVEGLSRKIGKKAKQLAEYGAGTAAIGAGLGMFKSSQ